MDAVEIELVAREVDGLQDALDAERHRHVAGLEAAPALASLFAARSRAAHRETVAALREEGREELAARVAALRAERAAAEAEERWRAAESTAGADGPDGPAALESLELAALREPDRERRLAFARAAAAAVGAAAGPREEALEVLARARAEVGLAPDWRAVVDGDEVLAATDDAWRDVLTFRARRDLGLAPAPAGDLTRADLLHLLQLARWDGLFKAPALARAVQGTLPSLGLDPNRPRLDAGGRPRQWPGVHVHGGRVSFRARGGAGDWQDLLAGLARAVAATHAPPSRRDPVLGEALAWLVSSLLLEPRWLAAHAGVERREAVDVVRDLALRRLLGLRAAAGALRVATEVARGLSGSAWREGYREALTAATGAAWDGARAARDADAPGLIAALQGAAAGEALRRLVRERFDEDWWRNPRTAPHLSALLAGGALPQVDPASAPAPAEAARALAERLEGKGG